MPARFFLVLIVMLVSTGSAIAQDDIVSYLNKLRVQAGMIPLQHSPQLSSAAAQHAIYLHAIRKGHINSFADAHLQDASTGFYTGDDVGSRAINAGYPHSMVSENISVGDISLHESVDLLMSGIYHRFGFLDYTIDEVGVGTEESSYVFNMGRNDLARTCKNPPPESISRGAYDCAGIKVNESFWKHLCSSIPAAAKYRAPFPLQCINGNLLKAGYMQNLCNNMPETARFYGNGRFYSVCRHKVKADWFDQLCDVSPAVYPWDGSYYRICDDRQKVHAKWFEGECNRASEQDLYKDSGEYYQLCSSQKKKIRVEYMTELNRKKYRANPDFVMWPPHNADQVMTTFYEEFPDPLPDQSISSYPVSLHFNPGKVEEVEVYDMLLQKRVGRNWQKVDDVRMLSKQTDPNGQLTSHQFALFGLKPFSGSADYRVTASVKMDGVSQMISWQFRTSEI